MTAATFLLAEARGKRIATKLKQSSDAPCLEPTLTLDFLFCEVVDLIIACANSSWVFCSSQQEVI